MLGFIGSCIAIYAVFYVLDRLLAPRTKPFPDLKAGQFIVQADDGNFYIVKDAPEQAPPPQGRADLHIIDGGRS